MEYLFEGCHVEGSSVSEEVSEFDRQMNKKESIELIKFYYSITDEKVRKKVLDLIKSMAKGLA